MIRLISFLLKLAVLVAGAVWLASHPGTVTVDWQGYEISTSVAVLVLAVAAFAGVVTVLYTLWRTLVGIPRAFSLGHLSRRQRKGYLALTQGMVAVAAGDAAAARRFAGKAEKLLNEPPLTMLLQAQAAQLNGDEAAASRYFNDMLTRPEMSFLGLRGLLTQSLKRGDVPAALTLARRARTLQPKAGWVMAALVDLEARAGHWDEALTALSAAAKKGALTPERARKVKSAALLAQSAQAEQRGQIDPALKFAKRAYDADAASVPVLQAYARMLIKTGRAKLAGKLIERLWRTTPHPALARLYAEAGGPGVTANAQVRRIERLVGLNPHAPDSQLALARAALDAQLWGIARAQLDAALVKETTAAACRLMAELEERENANPRKARDWLTRAAEASADPAWRCDDCQAIAPEWAPLCPSCGALASLSWRPPARPVNLLPPEAAKNGT